MDADILRLPEWRARIDGGRVALSALQDGAWSEVSFRDLARRCASARANLAARGLAGERVALLSESRPEWAVAFFATIQAGATLVPLDPKLTLHDRAAILEDCRPRLLLVSSHHAADGAALRARLPFVKDVMVLDDVGLATEDAWPIVERDPEDVALIVYTSGTTGRPKGVMVTLGNLDFEVARLSEAMLLGPESVFVSILPLTHLLEITGGLLTALHAGGEVAYPGSLMPEEVLRAMVDRSATHVIAVPLFLRLLKMELEKRVRNGSPPARGHFPALRGFVSGGAPLDPTLESFFRSLGIDVFQGYGLTETGPVIAVNTPGACAPGSVGRPLPGIEVRIAAEGEIWTRGPHVMKGYFGREALTAAVLDREGWLRTGDVGSLDASGYVRVTGRLKDLIVLGSGLKVHPEEVEEALARSSMFLEACVVGRHASEGLFAGTEEVCAVIVPGEGCGSEQAAREEVRRCCADLAPFKRPTSVVIASERLPRTPSLKVQRHRVAESVAAARLKRVS